MVPNFVDYQLRSKVNKILENARTAKLIGSSLDAKVYLHTESAETVSKLKELYPLHLMTQMCCTACSSHHR
jgi:hypothetical protein